ncbi:acyltransferase [Mesobacillus sp. AQ2]|uniref:acyltransferase n=1 Tax=Mesobacillus sp. AQ2 TaxID=3043332 RepID=UPI0024C2049C|nr:acyltransferase [Mesobacillus sp. AQ2]WHX40385.1 acyltransferase [Mesobacillus sp. AQ2]
MKKLLYIFYSLIISKIPGGNNSIGKSFRRRFQRLLGITLGTNAVIGHHTIISYHVLDKLVIGNDSGVGPYSYIMGTGKIIIGKNVICAPKITFVTRWHEIFYDKNGEKINIQKEGGITIGDNVFLGTNVTILPNVNIGEKSIIASGTTVYKSVPPNSFVRGAKMVMDRLEG